jgi:hypothetical protein
MIKRSLLAGLGPVLALVLSLGGCGICPRSAAIAYTTPGWYLERPQLIVTSGPEIFAGPFTYEQCENERVKFETARNLLCVMEKTKPPAQGPF